MKVLLSIFANAVALYATTIVPGIRFDGSLLTLAFAGAVLGLFNLVVRPIAVLLSLPLLIITLGLFTFVLNGILLWVASWLLPGYTVSGILPGILGALVLSVVNWAVHTFLGSPKKKD